MKNTTNPTPAFMNVIPFPNARSRRQSVHKVLDTLLIAFSGVGITATLAFLLVMG